MWREVGKEVKVVRSLGEIEIMDGNFSILSFYTQDNNITESGCLCKPQVNSARDFSSFTALFNIILEKRHMRCVRLLGDDLMR